MNGLKYQTYQLRSTKRDGNVYYDADQSRVYRAEQKARKEWERNGIELPEIKDWDQFVKRGNAILKSKKWKQLVEEFGGHLNVRFELGKNMGERTAYAGKSYGSMIRMSPMFLDYEILLHELAHSAGNMHHGRGFRRCHIALVQRFLGKDAAYILKQCYKEYGLKYSRPRREMTKEEYQRACERLQLAREKLNV